MEQDAILSKTGRAVFQMKCKPCDLREDQYRVLRMIDGKTTVRELITRTTMNEATVRGLLRTLADDGLIRETSSSYRDRYVDSKELDFTHYLGGKV
jgi:hypothetical protein